MSKNCLFYNIYEKQVANRSKCVPHTSRDMQMSLGKARVFFKKNHRSHNFTNQLIHDGWCNRCHICQFYFPLLFPCTQFRMGWPACNFFFSSTPIQNRAHEHWTSWSFVPCMYHVFFPDNIPKIRKMNPLHWLVWPQRCDDEGNKTLVYYWGLHWKGKEAGEDWKRQCVISWHHGMEEYY